MCALCCRGRVRRWGGGGSLHAQDGVADAAPRRRLTCRGAASAGSPRQRRSVPLLVARASILSLARQRVDSPRSSHVGRMARCAHMRERRRGAGLLHMRHTARRGRHQLLPSVHHPPPPNKSSPALVPALRRLAPPPSPCRMPHMQLQYAEPAEDPTHQSRPKQSHQSRAADDAPPRKAQAHHTCCRVMGVHSMLARRAPATPGLRPRRSACLPLETDSN